MNPEISFNEENAPYFYWNGVKDKVTCINFTHKHIDMDLTKFDLIVFTKHGYACFILSLEGIHAIELTMQYTNMNQYVEAPGAIAEYATHSMDDGVLVDDILPDRVIFKSKDTEAELTNIPYDYNDIVYADWLLSQSLRHLAKQRLWYIIRGVMLRYLHTTRTTHQVSMYKIMGARQNSREK